MNTVRMVIGGLGIVWLLAPAAQADWDPGDWHKMHHAQLPDLSPLGLDVNGTSNILADDFQCAQSGPITSIHIWGSWLYDQVPDGGAGDAWFYLSLHADIPKEQNPEGYSKPGDFLWGDTFSPGEFTSRIYRGGILEGWYDPAKGTYLPSGADTVCWQYNFPVDPQNTFNQVAGTTYWLDVKVAPGDEAAKFGWKTADPTLRWNDDAVWGTGNEPYDGPWKAVTYPVGHALGGESLDLAFVIVPEPATLAFLGLGLAGLLVGRRNR